MIIEHISDDPIEILPILDGQAFQESTILFRDVIKWKL